jgi:fructose-1-phosphate kinase PfkB-like protein
VRRQHKFVLFINYITDCLANIVIADGARDGVLAGMALAYSRRESLEYGLRHGFALAGAILQTLATADLRVEGYQALLSQICITSL